MQAKDALSTLLSVEALLVAALTLAATIGNSPAVGTKRTDLPARVAKAVMWLTWAVAAGGLAAWIQIFVLDAKGIDSGWDVATAFGLIAPLLGIPVFAGVCVRWARGSAA